MDVRIYTDQRHYEDRNNVHELVEAIGVAPVGRETVLYAFLEGDGPDQTDQKRAPEKNGIPILIQAMCRRSGEVEEGRVVFRPIDDLQGRRGATSQATSPDEALSDEASPDAARPVTRPAKSLKKGRHRRAI